MSLAIRHPADARVLLVRRPSDDAELPGVWGLPAATLGPGESWADAARRAARDKLGIEIEVGPELRRGEQVRQSYVLEMRLHEASVRAGEPTVPGSAPSVTHYGAWRWGNPAEVEPAALRGSLCARLMLEAETQP